MNALQVMDRYQKEVNEKCVFEITMHNDIAFKQLNKIVFHHLDMTQLNFNNVYKFYVEIIFKKKCVFHWFQKNCSLHISDRWGQH